MWFKNRRAKCRQQLQQQQNKPSATGQRTVTAPASKTKPSKSSPAIVPPSTTTTPSSNSPPVIIKKEQSSQIVNTSYKVTGNNNGNLTPLGSNTSSVMTTPSPPITPSSNPSSLGGYQHETSASSYNSFNWHANGHSSSPHHYYGQNYGQAYYNTHMDYFNQQNGQSQMQMGNHHHHVGSSYHQMGGYAGMTMTTHHQNFSPRHPDCSLDYMNQMV